MKKRLFMLISAFVAAASVTLLSGCDDDPKTEPEPKPKPDVVRVTSVTVSPSTLSLDENETYNLSAEVLPSNANNKAITWRTASSAIVSVNPQNGTIRAVGGGTTTVTAITNDGGLSSSCTVTVTPAPEPEPKPDEYTLVWADEFDYEGVPDPAFWTMETGGHGWGNDELQYYTNRIDNAEVSGGTLKIKLLRENYDNREYTSARLKTAGKKIYTYCKIEVRAKLPRGRGTWPAIWMLGQNIEQGTAWPDCGEIDIMEHVGYDEGTVHASIHTRDRNHKIGTQVTRTTRVPNCSDEFNVYSVEWTSNNISVFVNGTRYFSYTPESFDVGDWPFNKPQFLLLNVAYGGWGGAQGLDPSMLPQTMEVDYVRVYKKL